MEIATSSTTEHPNFITPPKPEIEDGMYRMPQPNEVPLREKEDAMGGYLMMFAAMAVGLPLPIINLIASIIYYFTNRDKGRFVRFHTLQALYSQIPTTLINAGFTFWTLHIIFWDWEATNRYWGYVCMMVLANLWYVVSCIVAAVKARRGQVFYMLFFGILAYRQVFTPRRISEEVLTNKAPTI